MNYVTRYFLFLAMLCIFFVESSNSQENQCIYPSYDGFTVEGKGEGSETYSCESPLYPYYFGLSFRRQQGLRCIDRLNSLTSVDLVCKNKSGQSRSIRAVTINCCNNRRIEEPH